MHVLSSHYAMKMVCTFSELPLCGSCIIFDFSLLSLINSPIKNKKDKQVSQQSINTIFNCNLNFQMYVFLSRYLSCICILPITCDRYLNCNFVQFAISISRTYSCAIPRPHRTFPNIACSDDLHR